MKTKFIIFLALATLVASCGGKKKDQKTEPKESAAAADYYYDDDDKSEAHTATSKKMYVNSTSGLTIREKPSTDAKKIGRMPNRAYIEVMGEENEEVTISGRKGKWVKVSYKEKEGYAFGGYLTNEKPKEAPPLPKVNVPKDAKDMYVSSKSGLVLREKPDSKSKRILGMPFRAKVKAGETTGDEMTISKQTGKWTKIYYSGTAGYAFGGFLSESKPDKEGSDSSSEKAEKINSKTVVARFIGVGDQGQTTEHMRFSDAQANLIIFRANDASLQFWQQSGDQMQPVESQRGKTFELKYTTRKVFDYDAGGEVQFNTIIAAKEVK